MDLGFGGPENSCIAKIPSRFFRESKVSFVTNNFPVYILYIFTFLSWVNIINVKSIEYETG